MSIQYFEKEKTFLLQGKETTYAMTVNNNGWLCHLYWGKKVELVSDLPTLHELTHRRSMIGSHISEIELLEYRTWGGECVLEPSLKITFPDGTRSLFLVYKSHEIQDELLTVTLEDTQYPVEVTLRYEVRPEMDIIERSAEIRNTGSEAFTLEMAGSANWTLPKHSQYRLTYFTGAYGHEFQMSRETFGSAKRVLESRRGLSGFDCAPFFMVDSGDATEEFGDVFFGSVIWSGNWKIVAERDWSEQNVIAGGINDFEFAYYLEPGQVYETPVFFAGYLTEGGFGGVSRQMHRYEREYIIHPTERNRVLPIIYNTHNSFYNRVDESIVMAEIDAAHEAGIELFILEGGWSGWDDLDSPVNNYHSHRLGFGTWEVNPKRFPNGLKPIADKIHGYGMKFGLWIEPEAVFHTSRIVQEHPDWIIGYDNRPLEISGAMGCYSLDMANDEACEYITNLLIKLVGDNEIDYIKNDFNRFISHMGRRGVALEHKQEGNDKYTRNMWKCYRSLKEAFPDLIFENSASGGKRLDLGMLTFAGRMHRSDNQDPLDSVTMFDTLSYFIPPKFHGGACFVSNAFSGWFNSRRTPIQYQGHMGMMSSLSVSLGLQEVSAECLSEIKRVIALAKQVREVVQMGDLYRIVSVLDNPYGAYQFVSEDATQSVVFIMGQHMHFAEMPDRVCLKALKPDAQYRVTGHGTYYQKPYCRYEPTQPYYYEEIPERTKDYGVYTGRGLMNAGLPIAIRGDAQSEVIMIEEIK